MGKEYVCCFTGHRSIDRQHASLLSVALDNAIEKMIKDGVTVFRSGGAVGFDTLAALKIIEKRQKYPHIRLELFLPCKNQSKKWNDFSQRTYEYILSVADEIHYTSQTYTPYCMHERDKAMVNGADYCIAYCVKSSGGTAFTLNYAYKCSVNTVNLADTL